LLTRVDFAPYFSRGWSIIHWWPVVWGSVVIVHSDQSEIRWDSSSLLLVFLKISFYLLIIRLTVDLETRALSGKSLNTKVNTFWGIHYYTFQVLYKVLSPIMCVCVFAKFYFYFFLDRWDNWVIILFYICSNFNFYNSWLLLLTYHSMVTLYTVFLSFDVHGDSYSSPKQHCFSRYLKNSTPTRSAHKWSTYDETNCDWRNQWRE
jgi:hypothetical protein